jgi:pimeloyl-ACP methyl ester carboxylesterase
MLYKVCERLLPYAQPGQLVDIGGALSSLASSLATHRHDSADHLNLGDKPLVVLSMDVDVCCPDNASQNKFWQAYKTQWYAQHAALARMSSRGVHRVIEGAGHSIMPDKPEAVIGAVDEVLRQLQAGAKR